MGYRGVGGVGLENRIDNIRNIKNNKSMLTDTKSNGSPPEPGAAEASATPGLAKATVVGEENEDGWWSAAAALVAAAAAAAVLPLTSVLWIVDSVGASGVGESDDRMAFASLTRLWLSGRFR